MMIVMMLLVARFYAKHDCKTLMFLWSDNCWR